MAQIFGDKWWTPEAKTEWSLVGSRQGSYNATPFDFQRQQLINLSKELSPAYIKIGGAKTDFVCYFEKNSNYCDSVLTKEKWDEINEFAEETGFEILFELNGGLGTRDSKKKWNPEISRKFIKYTTEKNYPVGAWKFGGEVNALVLQGLKWRVGGKQLAEDYSTLKDLVREYDKDAVVLSGASAFWPIIGEPFPVMKSFLKHSEGVEVVSWNYYPTQSSRCPVAVRRAKPFTLLDAKELDEFTRLNKKVLGYGDKYSPSSDVWLTETGNAQCGGQPGVSDRFISGLWWLDELGLAARNGNKVVVRQTLAGSDYGLINDETLEPNPDYWNSLLWKRLMGNKVLDTSLSGKDRDLRVYAHCSKEGKGVSVLIINLNRSEGKTVSFDSILGERKEVYVLTSDDVLGKNVLLNGKKLEVGIGGKMPKLSPIISNESSLFFEPISYSFIIFPDAKALACA